MRYINLDRLRMPDGWLARAQAASLAVREGASPDDYGDVWRDLKQATTTLSDTKCWYCESGVDRNDNAVDHFRPKNRVFEAINPHSGYRWLAFDHTNYRLACTYCNSKRIDIQYGTTGGKADRFPLLNENMRVYTAGSTAQEEPELLDPCNIADCELLGCRQENGHPCATSSDPVQKRRGETSINVYHLDREATCKRRHTVAVSLIADTMEAKRLFELSQGDSSKKSEFLNVAKRIQSNISRDAYYSGEMKFLLRGQRSDNHPWIQQLLEA